ncbi:MAG: hypothetical protein LBR37_02690 [Erysipelotrichaceae bacterium]|jgi:hypothetical protein|nr:hypothetical protein [Erysipelotrichaceae bacterium]
MKVKDLKSDILEIIKLANGPESQLKPYQGQVTNLLLGGYLPLDSNSVFIKYRGKYQDLVSEDEIAIAFKELVQDDFIESTRTKKGRNSYRIKSDDSFLANLPKDERTTFDRIINFIKENSESFTKVGLGTTKLAYCRYDAVSKRDINWIVFTTKPHNNKFKGYVTIRLFQDDPELVMSFRLKKEYENSIKHIINKYLFDRKLKLDLEKTTIQLEKELSEVIKENESYQKQIFDFMKLEPEALKNPPKQILVLGASLVDFNDLVAALKKHHYDPKLFKFNLEFEPAVSLDVFKKGGKYLAVIFGAMAHKLKGLENGNSLASKISASPDVYLPAFKAIAQNQMRITTSSFITATKQIEKELRLDLKVASGD